MAGLVREVDGFAKYRSGLRDGLRPEALECFEAEPFDARLLREVVVATAADTVARVAVGAAGASFED